MRRWLLLALLATALLLLFAAAVYAADPLAAPWNGQSISHGIGPTYGEAWPVPVPPDEAVANLQGPPPDNSTLAVMPYADIGPELQKFQNEAKAAGFPPRMTWYVSGKSAGGRDMYAVVVNDLETANQRQRLRTLAEHPRGRAHQSGRRPDAPHDVRRQRQDAHLRRGRHQRQRVRGHRRDDAGHSRPHHHAARPERDGRQDPQPLASWSSCRRRTPTVASWACAATAAAQHVPGVADTNRDYFLQSQPEEQIDAAIQQQWLATGALHLHGYEQPMLVDGDTMPLNAGTDAIAYYTWNSKRHFVTKADFSGRRHRAAEPRARLERERQLPDDVHLPRPRRTPPSRAPR